MADQCHRKRKQLMFILALCSISRAGSRQNSLTLVDRHTQGQLADVI